MYHNTSTNRTRVNPELACSACWYVLTDHSPELVSEDPVACAHLLKVAGTLGRPVHRQKLAVFWLRHTGVWLRSWLRLRHVRGDVGKITSCIQPVYLSQSADRIPDFHL